MSVINPTQEQLSQLKEHYKDIILTWPEGYDFCEVCLIKDGMQQDELIFCELCNGLIHQSCYGSELLQSIPENDWYCERCKEYIKDYVNENKLHEKTSIRCFFCPEQKGIVKKITIQQSGQQIWSHVGCIASIKSLNFVDTTRKLIVQKYIPSKTTDECRICGFKTGNCGYCHKTGCNFTFHYSCGKRIGIIQDVNLMNTLIECREKQFKNSEPDHHIVFCEEHLYMLSYVEYPDDTFLKEFIENMYKQRQIFDEETINLSSLLCDYKKCETITNDKIELKQKYVALGKQRQQQLKKLKKGSQGSLPSSSKQSLTNLNKDKSKSRSRSRSPPKSDKKQTAAGKKPKTSSSQLDNDKETSKKPQKGKSSQQQSSGNSLPTSTTSQKTSTTKSKVEKEETIKQSNVNQTEVKTKQSTNSTDKLQSKKQTVASSITQSNKNEQTSNNAQTDSTANNTIQVQTITQVASKKGPGKKGQKNEEDQNAQLIENSDNWRRIQKVMQTFDYRDKLNIQEEQKMNDDGFKTPFFILKELTEILPKRATLEQNNIEDNINKINSDKNNNKSIIQQTTEQTDDKIDEISDPNRESSNLAQMMELDSNVLDQDKIIEEQKQSELQNFSSSVKESKINDKPVEIKNTTITTNAKTELKPKDNTEMEIEEDNNNELLKSSKTLVAKSNKLSEEDKQRVYKRFIIEYVKQNKNKLQGPLNLYIIHPEMMQIMDIKQALPQRKMKKEVAHYFVQKECLNPIHKEVQISKCINQRIIDIFSDRNLPSNISSKNFYKLFKTHFLIKIYDSVTQLSEFDEVVVDNNIVQEQSKVVNSEITSNEIKQTDGQKNQEIQPESIELTQNNTNVEQNEKSNQIQIEENKNSSETNGLDDNKIIEEKENNQINQTTESESEQQQQLQNNQDTQQITDNVVQKSNENLNQLQNNIEISNEQTNTNIEKQPEQIIPEDISQQNKNDLPTTDSTNNNILEDNEQSANNQKSNSDTNQDKENIDQNQNQDQQNINQNQNQDQLNIVQNQIQQNIDQQQSQAINDEIKDKVNEDIIQTQKDGLNEIQQQQGLENIMTSKEVNVNEEQNKQNADTNQQEQQ